MTETKTRPYKYEVKCWHCGGSNLKDMGEYVKCEDCSATWNPVPNLKAPITARDRNLHQLIGVHDSGSGSSPSKIVTRRAAKQRGLKKQAAND